MALVELKTDLKSLKNSTFGAKDLLVGKDINDPPNSKGLMMQVTRRVDDLVRHTKLLGRKEGLKFIGNQALLAQTNLKQKIKQGKKDGDLGKVMKAQLIQTGINTVAGTASILAQIPVNGTGTHLIRGFGGNSYLKPSGDPSGINGLVAGMSSLAGGTGNTVNAAVNSLNGELSIPDTGAWSGIADYNAKATGEDRVNSILKTKHEESPSPLGDAITEVNNPSGQWNYLGEDDINNEKTKVRSTIVLEGGKITLDKDKIYSKHYFDGRTRLSGGIPSKGPKGGNTVVNKFPEDEIGQLNLEEAKINNNVNQQTEDKRVLRTSAILKANYETYEIDGAAIGTIKNPITIANPGKTRLDSKGAITDTEDRPDAIQNLGIETSALGVDKQDLIPFEFNTFTPGNVGGKFLYFRALLDGFADNYSGDWAGTKYVGRGEELYTYNGFKRDITFDFKAAAFSKADMAPLYEKLNALVGSTAPTYGDGLFMQGTFTKITVGDYLKKVPGIIKSVGLTWDKGTPWEIEGDLRVPHMLSVSIAFTPIHNFVPQEGSRFIG